MHHSSAPEAAFCSVTHFLNAQSFLKVRSHTLFLLTDCRHRRRNQISPHVTVCFQNVIIIFIYINMILMIKFPSVMISSLNHTPLSWDKIGYFSGQKCRRCQTEHYLFDFSSRVWFLVFFL